MRNKIVINLNNADSPVDILKGNIPKGNIADSPDRSYSIRRTFSLPAFWKGVAAAAGSQAAIQRAQKIHDALYAGSDLLLIPEFHEWKAWEDRDQGSR